MGLAKEETGTRNKGGGPVCSGADGPQREAPLVPRHGYSSAEDDAGLSSSDIGANWNEKHNSLFGILASGRRLCWLAQRLRLRWVNKRLGSLGLEAM